jgi:hypothetical protein
VPSSTREICSKLGNIRVFGIEQKHSVGASIPLSEKLKWRSLQSKLAFAPGPGPPIGARKLGYKYGTTPWDLVRLERAKYAFEWDLLALPSRKVK